MAIICNEFKKILSTNKLYCYILLFIILETLSIIYIPKSIDQNIVENKSHYEYYITKYHGAITDEKENMINEEANMFSNVKSELQKLYHSENYSNNDYNNYNNLKKILERENGFRCFYKQYIYAREDIQRRYLINPNGWHVLLTSDIDYLLVLFSISVTTVFFGIDIDSNMDCLIRTTIYGEKINAIIKLVISILIVICNYLLVSFIEYFFVKYKYGLNDGNSPIQSLEEFGTYSRGISLKEAYIEIILWRFLGIIMLVLLTCAIMLFLKKYVTTIIAMIIITIVPKVFFSNTSKMYLIPGPSGLLSAVGFIKGTQTNDYHYINKVCFSEIPVELKKIIVFENTIIIFIAIFYTLYKTSNFHKTKRILSCMVIISLSLLTVGCKSVNNDRKEYNCFQAKYDGYGQYTVFKNASGDIIIHDTESDEEYKLVTDPLSESKEIGDYFFLNKNRAYYVEFIEDRTNKIMFNEYDSFQIIAVDLNTLNETVIYKDSARAEIIDEWGLFSLYNNRSDIYANLQAFFLDNNDIFFITGDSAYSVNITTKKTKYLFSYAGNSISYYNGIFYYLDNLGSIITYDYKNEEFNNLENLISDEFIIKNNNLIYRDITNKNHLTIYDLQTTNKKEIAQNARNFSITGKNIIYVTDDSEIYCYNTESDKTSLVGKTDSDEIYVFDNWNKGIIIDYINNDRTMIQIPK